MAEVDHDAAVNRLIQFLAVEGVTGQEAAIGREIVGVLKAGGVPARAIRFDDAHKRIALPTETGNLIVNLPGNPKAIAECLDAVFAAIPYCIDLIEGPFLETNETRFKVFRPKQK